MRPVWVRLSLHGVPGPQSAVLFQEQATEAEPEGAVDKHGWAEVTLWQGGVGRKTLSISPAQ